MGTCVHHSHSWPYYHSVSSKVYSAITVMQDFKRRFEFLDHLYGSSPLCNTVNCACKLCKEAFLFLNRQIEVFIDLFKDVPHTINRTFVVCCELI